MSDPLGIDNDIVLLPFLPAFNNTVNDSLLISVILLRKKNLLSPICHTAPKSNIAGASTHYFDNGTTLVRSGSITNLINRLHSGINRGIKTDSIIRTCNIKVNGSRHTDGVHSECRKLSRSHKRSVSSDYDHAVNSVFFTDFSPLLLAFYSCKFFTTSSIENGSSAAYDVGYGMTVHIYNFFLYEPCIATHDTLYL